MRRERISPCRATAWAVCLAAFSSWLAAGLLLPFMASRAMDFPILIASCFVSAGVVMVVRRLLASTAFEAALAHFVASQIIGSGVAILITGDAWDIAFGSQAAFLLSIASAAVGHWLGLRFVILSAAPGLLWLRPLSLPQPRSLR